MDIPVFSSELKTMLQFDCKLALQTVSVQLREQAKRYIHLYKHSAKSVNALLSDQKEQEEGGIGPGSRGEMDAQTARETITGLIPQLYQRLNAEVDSLNAEQVLSILTDEPWLWVGDTFVSSAVVALNADINAAPYLYQLPKDLQVYSKLLSIFRIKSTFSSRDYRSALQKMAHDSESSEAAAGDASFPKSSGDACSYHTNRILIGPSLNFLLLKYLSFYLLYTLATM